MGKPKIFITGGHLTPAIATTDLLLKKGWRIWYISRIYAQEEDNSISIEYQTLQSYQGKLETLFITTGKLQRYLNLKSLLSLLKIPFGFLQSIYWVTKFRPNIILSFGGYVAVPVALVAWGFGIPIVTHEQTRSVGSANKLIVLLASKICLTWQDSKKYFSNKKVSLTGLPIRNGVFKVKKNIPINLSKPLIYISGGSLGSHTINLLVLPIITKLVKDFSVIHQCGETKKFNDYEKLLKIRERLPDQLKDSYFPITYITIDRLGWLYKNAAFCISRSGANTVYELAAVSLPAIFIPISWSRGNEQYLNAKFFEENTSGVILDQNKINSEKLYQEILLFKKNLSEYKRNADKLKDVITIKGDNNLVQILEQKVNEKNKNLI